MTTSVKLRLRALALHPLAPYLVFGLFTALWHFGLVVVDVDEAFYGSVLGRQPLWEFLAGQYAGWSSRTVIEFFLCIFSSLPRWVWRAADTAVLTGLALAMGRLARGDGPSAARWEAPAARRRIGWLTVALLWLYPWWYLSTAGWVATTMNYLWPLAGLCLALLSLTGWGGRAGAAAGLLGLVYGVNAEQTAVLALFLLAAFAAQRLAARRPLPRLLYAQAAIALAGLGYMLACPGVKLRSAGEAASYYRDFAMQSFLSKAEAGISGALGELFLDRNLLYTLFFALLAAAVWQASRCLFYRLVCLAPLAAQLALGVLLRHWRGRLPALADAVTAARGVGTVHVANCNDPLAYLPFLLLCGGFALVCGCVYIALGHTRASFAALTLLLAGFCTRAAIGFTPASAVSGERTGFLFAACVAGCGLLLGRQLDLRRPWQKALAAAVVLPLLAVQFLSLWEI